MKGGVGKTTLSTNICDCLSSRHDKKILLVDVDPQFNATQCVFSGEEYVRHLKDNKDTIIDIFDDKSRVSVGTVNGTIQEHAKELKDIQSIQVKKNFYILPGNLNLFRIEMASGSGRENRLKRYLEYQATQGQFDYVIIDTPPTPSVWMTSALVASNYYLIPVKPDPISFTGIDLLKTIIKDREENFDLAIKCIGLIFTMVERPDSVVYNEAREKAKSGEWKNYLYKNYIPKRTEIAKYQLNKDSFILNLGDSESKMQLTGIVDELLKRIENDRQK